LQFLIKLTVSIKLKEFCMKNKLKLFGIIALAAVIGFSMAVVGCDLFDNGDKEDDNGGNGGGGGGGGGGGTYLDFTYTGTDTITITKYNGTGGNVTIPAQINGKPVTSIGTSAFQRCTSLTSVTIPDSVTTIGGRFSRDQPYQCNHTKQRYQHRGLRFLRLYQPYQRNHREQRYQHQ
jgi:hypothetical protein